MFDAISRSLSELLADVDDGRLQLPDFQRGWVWDDDHIKSVIGSVAKSFPIGAIMLLETGNEEIRFNPKPVEGVNTINNRPELLLLDGQQRITSLYQTVVTKNPVNTKNSKDQPIKRWYYIDMSKALNPGEDLEEAIFSVKEDKIITSNIGRDIVLDLSNREKEYEKLMFPVNMMRNSDFCDWRLGFSDYWHRNPEKYAEQTLFCNEFERKVILPFNSYHLPVIKLRRTNTKEAICQVFEKVNTGGVALTAFELLTATYASENFDLKKDWEKNYRQLREHKSLTNVCNTDLIQSITLYSTYRRRIEAISTENLPPVSAKRKEMLNLPLSEYLARRDNIVAGYVKASKILLENHIFNARDLPYSTQLIPMAAILADLKEEIDNVGKKKKLMRWFWCGVLGELYGASNDTRYALDITQVIDWIRDCAGEPRTILDANFSPSRFYTLRTRNSAAYKGIYALLMEEQTKDWLSATKIDLSSYFAESIDIHHIFPVAWCEKNGINKNEYNSIINKTPLSGRTNRIVGGEAPSKYLERVKKHAGVEDEEFETIIRSHAIDPTFLYRDDFRAFFADRKERILRRIESAMGKEISRMETADQEIFNEEGDEEES